MADNGPFHTFAVRVPTGSALVSITCGDCGAVVEYEVQDRTRLDLKVRSFGRSVQNWAFCGCGRSNP